MRRPLANTTAIAHGPSRSAARPPPITLTLTSLLALLWLPPDFIRSRLSPRCSVLNVIPWIRKNSLRAKPLVANSRTSRWTSCRVRRHRDLASSGSVIPPLQQIPPRNARCGWQDAYPVTFLASPDVIRTHGRPLAQLYRLRLNGHRLYYIISLFKVTYKSTIQVSRKFHALFTKTLENSDTCD